MVDQYTLKLLQSSHKYYSITLIPYNRLRIEINIKQRRSQIHALFISDPFISR